MTTETNTAKPGDEPEIKKNPTLVELMENDNLSDEGKLVIQETRDQLPVRSKDLTELNNDIINGYQILGENQAGLMTLMKNDQKLLVMKSKGQMKVLGPIMELRKGPGIKKGKEIVVQLTKGLQIAKATNEMDTTYLNILRYADAHGGMVPVSMLENISDLEPIVQSGEKFGFKETLGREEYDKSNLSEQYQLSTVDKSNLTSALNLYQSSGASDLDANKKGYQIGFAANQANSDDFLDRTREGADDVFNNHTSTIKEKLESETEDSEEIKAILNDLSLDAEQLTEAAATVDTVYSVKSAFELRTHVKSLAESNQRYLSAQDKQKALTGTSDNKGEEKN